ncbi:hypothetical protein B0H67DRAFT_648613 [Lasiosphaeris hirsuta]|uniref:Uncharacterized protein n=1 Tax=Lasiosphaeris hirsuta TaxID=260670 RepID=A0AA40DPM1_9PEZI|nr:hypothetical protein B0H67DRAFT_648613 [Lasiosphaeris hirsuta]
MPAVQILSDLHLETLKLYDKFKIVPPRHPTWIGPPRLAILKEFEQIVSMDGSLGDFVLLDRAVFRPDKNSANLGCRLFSHVPPPERFSIVRQRINDFHHTKDWNIALHTSAMSLGSTSRLPPSTKPAST